MQNIIQLQKAHKLNMMLFLSLVQTKICANEDFLYIQIKHAFFFIFLKKDCGGLTCPVIILSADLFLGFSEKK